MPTLFTPSLTGTEDFPTDGDRLIQVVEKYWRAPEVEDFTLDDWQRWLLRHLLEKYPHDHARFPGQLRYRQVLASMGRQNGKSVLGGIMGFYGLAMHEPGPQVIGLASSADQATIIYDRVHHVVGAHPVLARKFRATGTRGISRRDGSGTYKVKPAKGDALQGIPISMTIFDEVHISKPDLWQAVVNGLRTRKNGMVLGITTAGDDESVLLKRLYEVGKRAADGDPKLERFGFFLWEAPEGSTIDDDDAIKAGNPSVASGRIDLDTVRGDVANLPEPDQTRYVLNRFVASTSNWLPMHSWFQCEGEGVGPDLGPLVFSIDRSANWEFATIAVSANVDGVIHTELVARIIKPSLEQLLRLCLTLRNHGQVTFAMDSYVLGDLAKELKSRGLSVFALATKEVAAACASAYAHIVQGKVSHPNEDLLRHQMPRAARKNYGEAWRISRQHSSVEIDGVMATVMGLYVSATQRPESVQLF